MNYIIDPITNAFKFKGRATRKQFIIYFLFHLLVIVPITYFVFPRDYTVRLTLTEVAGSILRILTLFPLFFLGFRRLRDAGWSPWLFLIPLINILLGITLPSKEVSTPHIDLN